MKLYLRERQTSNINWYIEYRPTSKFNDVIELLWYLDILV